MATLVFYSPPMPRVDVDTRRPHRPEAFCDPRLADDEICKEPLRPEIPEPDTLRDEPLTARSSHISRSDIQLLQLLLF